MASFKDSKGRTWLIRITPRHMIEVEKFCGRKLGTVLQNDAEGLGEILGDPAELCKVLWPLVSDDAEKRGISLDDFLESVVGDPIDDACAALLEGLHDCFPTSQAIMLMAMNRLVKSKQNVDKQKLETLLIELTPLDSASRWQRFLAWIRSHTLATSSVACCLITSSQLLS